MSKNKHVSIPQLASLLGISRIAVYKKVRKGQIKAIRIGKNYAIPVASLESILEPKGKAVIDAAIKKTMQEYGEVLRLLDKD